MKKLLSAILIGVAVIGVLGVVPVQAQSDIQPQVTSSLESAPYESIPRFHSTIKVNTDNSIDVTEHIKYTTGPASHHGIYRDIYPYSSQNRKMSIEDISVTGENGELGGPYQYTVSNVGKYVRIKIGDPNETFLGQKTYIVRYRATNAIAQYDDEDHDEIYWNVTGNTWGFPILYAEATVSVPEGVQPKQSSCYYGPEGSKTQCAVDSVVTGTNVVTYFKNSNLLRPGDQVTVAVGFPKGVVTPYSATDEASNFFARYWKLMLAILLPILTFILSYRNWYAKGRDDRPTSTIIPQYDVPDGLNPLEAIAIIKEKVPNDAFSAEIVYLATQGYIRIVETENKMLGLIKQKSYNLLRLTEDTNKLKESDRKLIEALFSGSSSVALSDLKDHFYMHISKIGNSAKLNLVNDGYYKTFGKITDAISLNPTGRVAISYGIRFVIYIAIIIMGSNFLKSFLEGNFLYIGIGIGLSIVVYSIFYQLAPAKTDKGVGAKEHLLGLKEYLQIAEKDRLEFHNAPEKKPEVFEKLLPYAMVLGVADIWAKEFEGIYTAAPSWYSGPYGSNFNALILANSLSNFSTVAASSLTSSPRSSGSGGGGFSGGGGGGGGGGSW